MSGRHLRRGRGSVLRPALAALAVLVVGAALGAGGSLLLEDRDADVRTAGTGRAGLVPDPGPITIALVGDIIPGVALDGRLAGAPEDLLGPLGDVLRDANLAVANVDAPIVVDPSTTEVPSVPPDILPALAASGVDVVSAANDRSLDLGVTGLQEALAADQGTSALVGIGTDEDEAYRPLVRQVGGHTVAVLGATQLLDAERIATDTAGPDQAGVASAKRVDRLVTEVRAARAEADTVVVYLHWGEPGATCPGPGQQELAAALVDAGADVVAGPGSGQVQGAGRSGDAAVAYGLGAFVADDPTEPASGVLLVEVEGRDVLGIDWVPARRDAGIPVPLGVGEAEAAVTAWEGRRSCTGLGDP